MERGTVPFCTNCGSQVGYENSYCPNCGTRQPGSPGSGFGSGNAGGFGQYYQAGFPGNISDRTASILCYIPVFGIIAAIVFLASQRFRYNTRVRFDGFQSVYLFVAWLIVSSALPTLVYAGGGFPPFEHSVLGLLKLAVFGCWLYVLIKAAQNQQVHLPIIGDLAARSTTEQL
jgi:uncharacterized membrane protein